MIRKAKIKSWIIPLACALPVLLCTTACSGNPFNQELIYSLHASNIGIHGVMIKEPSLVNSRGKPTNLWHGVSPGLPGVAADIRVFPKFAGYNYSLPEGIVRFKWQLAELSNCEKVFQSSLPKYADHVRKAGCTWTPIKGKVFSQDINMATIRASKEYKQVGETIDGAGSFLSGSYTLVVELIFNEDQLQVKPGFGTTRGLMQ